MRAQIIWLISRLNDSPSKKNLQTSTDVYSHARDTKLSRRSKRRSSIFGAFVDSDS